MAPMIKMEGRMSEWSEYDVEAWGLDKATSAALGIDFPEPFSLFALG